MTETKDAQGASRRWLLGGGLAAMATGTLLAPGRASAASPTDPWLLGGNTGLATDGSSYLGTTDAAPLILKTDAIEWMRITPAGRVGIGTRSPSALLDVNRANGLALRAMANGTQTSSIAAQGTSLNGTGVLGQHTATTGTSPGVLGETSSAAADAVGVLGRVNPTDPGASSGVKGVNNGTGPSGVGVWGTHAGGGYGVLGTSVTGSGLVAQHTAIFGADPAVLGTTASNDDNAVGVLGRLTGTSAGNLAAAVKGVATGLGLNGIAVFGQNDGLGVGVYGRAAGGRGVLGESDSGVGVSGRHTAATGTNAGVLGETSAGTSGSVGVLGWNHSTSPGAESAGVHGVSSGTGTGGSGVYGSHAGSGNGVWGSSTHGLGVWGTSSTTDGTGVKGQGRVGVWGTGTFRAGYFDGDVEVTGTLTKSAGSFLIDHPLEPATKTLTHSFVESDEMKNVYDGTVTTDADGRAEVELPRWFEALNKDLRYQLTVVGQFAQAIVAAKVSGGRFVIATDRPEVEVCWQVTGVRQDVYANAHRLPVESDKPAAERGTYLHPELFGRGPEAGRLLARHVGARG